MAVENLARPSDYAQATRTSQEPSDQYGRIRTVPNQVAADAVTRLAARTTARTEADIQADVYLLLTAGGLNLQPTQVARLEVGTGDGTRRRIDVEVGHCVIEIKRDLRQAGTKADAEAQLAGYVATQTERLGRRYVGMLTDGTDWYLYRLDGTALVPVAQMKLNATSPDTDRLLIWLEAILATEDHITPTPLEIKRRLGADSPAHDLDHASLAALYRQAAGIPEVGLKRGLWARLLRTAFGKAFTDDETLFIDHTLLVLTAEIIAHAVVGFDITPTGPLTPAAMASGTMFASSQIHGVVEADFFDWVLHADGGPQFITDLADRIAKFDWGQVEHDVLKLLYESVIPAEVRADLGEYYTPDWLADRVVASTVTDPLNQRVLDPGCGSGTFVFHAARAFLTAAEAAGMTNGEAVAQLTEHVFGMDVHPVAVTLARVTYLLAIGADRLAASDRGPLSIPVYLGDSLQWEQRQDLLGGADTVTISTDGDDLVAGGGGALFSDDLRFPRSVLTEAGIFDQLVTAMADRAGDTSTRSSADVVAPVMRQFGIHANDVPVLTQTFDTMRRLQADGRNHIWGYYVRNLIRPLWLAEPGNRVNVLVGNPPWLRYSKMLTGMQERYKSLAKERGLLTGGLGASSRELSTLFAVRAIELYLKLDGAFAFVMPHGVLSRRPHDGFRSGKWGGRSYLTVAFDESWDLSEAPTGFPMVSCVIRGTHTDNAPSRMNGAVEKWVASFSEPNSTWEAVKDKFTYVSGTVAQLGASVRLPESPYRSRFRQGAVLAPRALLFVEGAPAGPLGAGAGRVALRSMRRSGEKPPWKDVPSLSGNVEKAFVRPVYLGETTLPYRILFPLAAVLPVTRDKILTAGKIDEQPGLAPWWAAAEATWEANKKADSAEGALLERIDFHGQLSAQLPTATQRVVYSKAGNWLAAARIDDPNAIIDHKLYWAAVSSIDEARYLVAILNSQTVLDRVQPFQALGLFKGRDFDKNVFMVAIPTYDATNTDHKAVADLGKLAEDAAATADISRARTFQQARAVVRQDLAAAGLAARIEDAVNRVLPQIAIP